MRLLFVLAERPGEAAHVDWRPRKHAHAAGRSDGTIGAIASSGQTARAPSSGQRGRIENRRIFQVNC
jgi:hypothetical protein